MTEATIDVGDSEDHQSKEQVGFFMTQSEAHDFSPVECLEKAKPNLDLNLQEFQQLQSATVTFGQGGEVKSDEVHPKS